MDVRSIRGMIKLQRASAKSFNEFEIRYLRVAEIISTYWIGTKVCSTTSLHLYRVYKFTKKILVIISFQQNLCSL